MTELEFLGESDGMDCDYYRCPDCGAAVCTWCDCPECGWYSAGAWKQTLEGHVSEGEGVPL